MWKLTFDDRGVMRTAWILCGLLASGCFSEPGVAPTDRDADADLSEKDLTATALGLGQQYVAQGVVRSAESVSALLFTTARQVAVDQHLLEPAADLAGRRKAFRDELRGILDDMETVDAISRDQFFVRERNRRGMRSNEPV